MNHINRFAIVFVNVKYIFLTIISCGICRFCIFLQNLIEIKNLKTKKSKNTAGKQS